MPAEREQLSVCWRAGMHACKTPGARGAEQPSAAHRAAAAPISRQCAHLEQHLPQPLTPLLDDLWLCSQQVLKLDARGQVPVVAHVLWLGVEVVDLRVGCWMCGRRAAGGVSTARRASSVKPDCLGAPQQGAA